MNVVGIIILSIVGLGCAIAIYFTNKYLPSEAEHLKKAEELSQILPGMNCGACGKAGCFAYAQSLAQDPNVIVETPCMAMMKNEEAIKELEDKLGMKLAGSDMNKVAIIRCNGQSDLVFDYHGINTCKAAAQLAGGYKKCPFGCLGLGDCMTVCPENAISIDEEKNIAIFNHSKCIGCDLCTKECPNSLIEVVPGKLAQYLGCSYTSKKNIVNRDRCKQGCIHCHICEKTDPDALDWDSKKDLPRFVEKNKESPNSVKKCPKKIIVPLALDMSKYPDEPKEKPEQKPEEKQTE